MSDVTMQRAQRLATLLSGAIKGISFYPAGHPAVKQPIQEMSAGFQEILRDRPEVRLGLHDGVFFFDEHLFVTPPPAVQELADRFGEKEIEGVDIERGVEPADMEKFAGLLARKGLGGKALERALGEEGIRHVRLTVPEPQEEELRNDTTELETLETYSQALEAIRDVIKDIEKGRIPSSGKILTVVKNMVTLTIQDPSTLLGLAMIKDYDNYTFNHCVNVGVLSMALGASLGQTREEIEEVGMAGFLHDVGKTRVDKNIINKPGKLSAEEFEQMKKHSEIGAQIVGEMDGIGTTVVEAVLGHHIHFDRQGYPEWAKDKSFNVMSAVIAIADCYDAITTLRVYQRPMSPKAAVDQLRRLSGTILDADLVTSFVEMMGKYPVGTLVRLDTNEIAVVFRPNPANSECPVVKIIFDAHGELLDNPQVARLVDDQGVCLGRIVAVVDPVLKNIEVGKYLS
ncbi:MAG TPA: HD-GYP domain-containing protein [Geobacteraceae bacterium]